MQPLIRLLIARFVTVLAHGSKIVSVDLRTLAFPATIVEQPPAQVDLVPSALPYLLKGVARGDLALDQWYHNETRALRTLLPKPTDVPRCPACPTLFSGAKC